MQFEYYVLNYNANKKKVEPFNVFSNISLNDRCVSIIKNYLNNAEKYTYTDFNNSVFVGYKALCEEIKNQIKWQEHGRREYEISVSDAFETDINKLEKWDCYMQCLPNITIIVDAMIKQYQAK